MKKLLLATAAGGLMMSTAFAQAPAPGSNAPAATPPAATTPAAPSTAATTTAPGSAKFVAAQTSDQWLASKFTGMDVVGNENEKIGDVNDMVFDKDGKIVAYVVGVGGFLGIGSKDVALEPAAFQIMPGDNGMYDAKLKLGMTKDQLKNAQAFEKYNPPARTAAPGAGTSRPAGGTTGSSTTR